MATLTTFFRKRKTIKKAKDKANPTPKVKPKQLIKNKKPGNPGKRSTKETSLQLIGIIAQLLADMESRADIIEIIGEKYGIGAKMVDVYMRKARDKITETIAGDVDRYIAQAVFRLRAIKRRAAKSKNMNVVLGAEKEINRILIPRKHIVSGMGKDGKIEHSVDIGAIIAKDKTRAAEVVQILHECSGNA